MWWVRKLRLESFGDMAGVPQPINGEAGIRPSGVGHCPLCHQAISGGQSQVCFWSPCCQPRATGRLSLPAQSTGGCSEQEGSEAPKGSGPSCAWPRSLKPQVSPSPPSTDTGPCSREHGEPGDPPRRPAAAWVHLTPAANTDKEVATRSGQSRPARHPVQIQCDS